jgi:hypothetical protein
LYRRVQDAEKWRNPILTVQDDGVDVAVDELKAVLITLPVRAWPYGRVVAQTDQSILPVPWEDYLRNMSQTRARVSQVLKELHITAELWPSA